MKKLVNLNGVKMLTKEAQKAIQGGANVCDPCAGKHQGSRCFVNCNPGNVGICDGGGGGPIFCAAF